MKEKVGEEGRIEYWTFVRAKSFADTVLRAQIASLLVSYGMAMLEKRKKKMFLIQRDPTFSTEQGSPLSLPIPIPMEAVAPRAK